MRLLILAAAATLVVTGAAMARESVHHHHHVAHHHSHNASAPIAEGSAPADTLSAHDAYMQNLHDSGYNSHSDRDAFGNVRQN
jgi:ABC-type molybdate transport system substrate-binding protein